MTRMTPLLKVEVAPQCEKAPVLSSLNAPPIQVPERIEPNGPAACAPVMVAASTMHDATNVLNMSPTFPAQGRSHSTDSFEMRATARRGSSVPSPPCRPKVGEEKPDN